MGRDQCAQPHFTSYRALVLERWFWTVYIGSLRNLIVLRDSSWFPELGSKWTRHLYLRSIIHIKDTPIACDLSLGLEDHLIHHPSNLVDFQPSSTRHKDAECMQLISWIALGPSWLYIYYCTPCGAQGHGSRGNRCVSHCSSSIRMILIRALFVCLCNGNSIWVKGIKLYEWPMGEQEAGNTTGSSDLRHVSHVADSTHITTKQYAAHCAYLLSSRLPPFQASQRQMSLSSTEFQGAEGVERQRKRAQNLRSITRHFRVLIIGRANAGKTTILQRVCNTTEQPKIFNREGHEVFHVLDIII